MKQNSNSRPIVLTGITPTGHLTIGNYVGAIKPLLKLLPDHDIYVFVANLHGITLAFDPDEMWANIQEVLKLYIACGLTGPHVKIFLQSDIPAHTELAYILQNHTTIGELSRMTQYKTKSANLKASNQTQFIPTGLLTYPTLMAADILLYQPDLVPVGADQKQHIELTRNLAQRLNQLYHKKLFKIPSHFTSSVFGRIMDLKNPVKKMSKSAANPKSYISLLDPPAIVKTKIKTSLTDSYNTVHYDEDQQPGISNLMKIYASLNDCTIAAVEAKFKNQDYGVFKQAVAEKIIQVLEPIQACYEALAQNKHWWDQIKANGKMIRQQTASYIQKIYATLGLDRHQ